MFNIGGDPVHDGLVVSLNRPGGNATGVSSFLGVLGAKRLGLLHEMVPGAGLVGVLSNPNDPIAASELADAQSAAATTGQKLVVARASNVADIDGAFATLAERRVNALLVISGPLFFTHAINCTVKYLVASRWVRARMTPRLASR